MSIWPATRTFAQELLKNPFAAEAQTDWSTAKAWLCRPSTIVAIVVANIYIFANYFSHRIFVLRVFKAWENFDGVRCGTGFVYNHIAITQGALFTLIPLGIMFMTYSGISSDSSLSHLRSLHIRTLAQKLRPWFIISLLWVLWLAAINAALFSFMSPDDMYHREFFLDHYGFPLLFFVPIVVGIFVGSWFGLALPVLLLRNDQRAWVKGAAGFALIIGLVILIPQLLSQTLVQIDLSFEEQRQMVFWHDLSTISALPYLGLMFVLFPLWIPRYFSVAPLN